MILHAQINQDGTLNASLPELFWGKKVVIVLSEEYDYESFKTTSKLQNESKPEHDETAYLLTTSMSQTKTQGMKQLQAWSIK